MASPQIEKGYCKVADELLMAFCRTKWSDYQARIFWFILRKTYGFRKKMDRIPLSQFAKGTGIDRRHCHRVLRVLEERQIIVTHRGDKRSIRYGIQKNYERWKLSPIQASKAVVTHTGDKVSPLQASNLSPVQAPSSYISNTIHHTGPATPPTDAKASPPTPDTKQDRNRIRNSCKQIKRRLGLKSIKGVQESTPPDPALAQNEKGRYRTEEDRQTVEQERQRQVREMKNIIDKKERGNDDAPKQPEGLDGAGPEDPAVKVDDGI